MLIFILVVGLYLTNGKLLKSQRSSFVDFTNCSRRQNVTFYYVVLLVLTMVIVPQESLAPPNQ